MRTHPSIAFTGLALVLATPTHAAESDAAGTWRVHGQVSAFAFDLTCRFVRKDGVLSGVCYDGGTNKPHRLTRGAVSGDRVSWTYQSNYLLKTFDAAYSGTLAGDSMSGDIVVPGNHGHFTAVRQP